MDKNEQDSRLDGVRAFCSPAFSGDFLEELGFRLMEKMSQKYRQEGMEEVAEVLDTAEMLFIFRSQIAEKGGYIARHQNREMPEIVATATRLIAGG